MVRSFDRLANVCRRPLHSLALDAKRRATRLVSHPNGVRLDDLAELALDVHLLVVAHGGEPGILIELAAQRRLHDPVATDGPDLTVREHGILERGRMVHSFISTIRRLHPDLLPDELSFDDLAGPKLCTCAGEDHDPACSYSTPELRLHQHHWPGPTTPCACGEPAPRA